VAAASEVKLKAAPKQTGANMTLAARAVGDRAARAIRGVVSHLSKGVALPRLEVLAVEQADEGQYTSSGEDIERGEGLARDAELADRTESYFTGAGEGMFGAKLSSTKSESLPEGKSLPQPSCERNACAATAREPRVDSRKKRVCSEGEVLPWLLAAGEEADCGDATGDGIVGLRT